MILYTLLTALGLADVWFDRELLAALAFGDSLPAG
jgi:hypothetical protein